MTNVHVTVSQLQWSYPSLMSVKQEFSNIHWRIYTEDPSSAGNPPEGPASGLTILKHLSRLKELELRLRCQDCLATCYPKRLGLWVFSSTPDFENLKPLCTNENEKQPNRIRVGSSLLKGLYALLP